jgi:hypothetical protein
LIENKKAVTEKSSVTAFAFSRIIGEPSLLLFRRHSGA